MNLYFLGILAALVVFFAVGIAAGRMVKDTNDYYVSGRNAPTLLIVGSLIASFLSTGAFLGDTGEVYSGFFIGIVTVGVIQATGYIYGYVQDLESGMWQYIILDFATGETVFTMDVSNKYGYNNMAIGMYAGNSGNALYCPTGYLELLCLQDRFVSLPEMPYRKVDLDKVARNVLSQAQFEQDGGEGAVASWRNTVTVENVHPNTTVSFRMNNLSGSAAELKLYAYGADGKLAEVSKELWTITDEAGTGVDTLADGTLYELRVSVADGGAFDLSEAEKEIKISVVLAK